MHSVTRPPSRVEELTSYEVQPKGLGTIGGREPSTEVQSLISPPERSSHWENGHTRLVFKAAGYRRPILVALYEAVGRLAMIKLPCDSRIR